MRTHKFLSLLIIFTMVLGILGIDRSYAANGTTIKLSLSPATAGRQEYYTNEEMLVNMDLDLSGYDTNIPNAELTVTVPKEFLVSMVGSQIGSATGPVVTTTADGQYVLTYHFNQLTGGTSIRIPIRVQTVAGDTPNNYVLPISATLSTSTAETLATAEPLNLTQVTRDPMIQKWKNNNGSNVNLDGSIAYGGQGTAADPNIIQPGTEVNQLFNFGVAFESVTGTTAVNYLGVRRYEKIVATDTLPAGAVFSAAANPGWTYDSATNKVSYSLMNPGMYSGSTSYQQLGIPALKLTFPNGDTRLTYTNTAQLEFFPKNKQDYEGPNVVSTDGIKFQMTTNLPVGITTNKTSTNFIDQLAQKTASQSWTCTSINPSDTFNMENLVLEDYNLDPRMEYVSVRLGGAAGTFTGTVNIEGVDAAGNVIPIKNNAPWQGTTEYAVPAGTVKIVIKSTSGSYLMPLKTFTFYVKTKLKDPANVHYNATTTANNKFDNSMKLSGEYVGTDVIATGSKTGSVYILEYKPTVRLLKTSSVATLFVGEETTFSLSALGSGTMLDPDTILDSSFVDLLPQGLDYVAGSVTISAQYSSLLVSKEPTVTKNYKGTGRTALIWAFSGPVHPASTYMSLSYKAKVTKEMPQGKNTNEAYWIWSNNGTGNPGTQQVGIPSASYGKADSLDLDNDGNKTETVAYASAPVTYVPPREVLASKYVKGSLDIADTLDGGRTEIGADFNYTLKVWNNSITDVNRLTVLEVFPSVGDKTIVADAAGNYLDRNSEFPVSLTGPVVGPLGYTAYYTTEIPASDSAASPTDYGTSANWVVAPLVSDWSAIRGVKIVMNGGVVLAKDAVVSFNLPVKSPTDMSLKNGETACNTFAISMNGGKNFLEAKAVSTNLVSYQVTGTMFEDENKDGLINSGEPIFANKEVQLFNEDGTPALDLDGNPIKATTKADGTYQLNVYKHGNYYVHMAVPQYYETTTQGADDNPLASHVSVTTGNTKSFSLTPELNSAVRNGGYYSVTGDIHLQKTVLDADGKTKADGEGPFTFEVSYSGKPYVGDVEIDGKVVNVTDGLVTFTSGQDVWIRNITEGTSYEVKELDASDYILSPVDGTYTGTIKAKDQITLSFENKEKALGELTIKKVLIDGGASGGGYGIVRSMSDTIHYFTILVTGPSYPDGQEMTLGTDKPLTLTGLKYGTYEVKELNASLYYVAVSGTATLDVNDKKGEVTVTNTKKQVMAKAIEIEKKVTGEPKTNEIFTFELTPDDVTFPMPAGSDGKQNISTTGPGSASFGTWAYTELGTYTYQVKEVAGANNHYTYDDSIYEITDTVTLNDSGELEVTRAVKNDAGDTIDGALIFNNQFKAKPVSTATVDIKKIVTGDPKVDETFAFELAPIANNFPSPAAVIEKKETTIMGSGTATFGSWSYTAPGVYVYQVKEVAGGNPHYTYDDTLYTIIDTVTLNDRGDLEVARVVKTDAGAKVDGKLIFNNQFKPEEGFPTTPEKPEGISPVSTGDNSTPYLWLMIAILSLIVLSSLGYYWLSAKRKTKHQDK